ncbi:hypothetical protein, partial [Dialister hominis]|uniref:hypothetical protein n=1 Tax=Dialister hominis TaxID=2582419 RepID=UPI0026DD809D
NCKCYFYLCRYLLCHLGWDGWEEQAELIKKEGRQSLRLAFFYFVRIPATSSWLEWRTTSIAD